MTDPSHWDPVTAATVCPIIPWHGSAWRIHRRQYLATDFGGSLAVSGRYHRARDQFPPDLVSPALYLALGPETCLGEIMRHLVPQGLAYLNELRLTELWVELQVVLGCRDTALLGLATDDLCHDTDYRVPQALAAAALERGVEGMLVPSATRLGDNLIVFPTQLRPESRITVVGSRDPRLHVPRC